jgi:hypothetical protein
LTSHEQSYIKDGKAFLVIDNRQESIIAQKLSGIRYNQAKVLHPLRQLIVRVGHSLLRSS